jgi:hypothetical protein
MHSKPRKLPFHLVEVYLYVRQKNDINHFQYNTINKNNKNTNPKVFKFLISLSFFLSGIFLWTTSLFSNGEF